MGEEWSLVLFTLLAQTSVGMVVASQFSPAVENKNAKTVLQWAIGIMAASLLVSLTHLGDPLGAYRALFNVGSSWLSREVFLASGYFGLSLLLYLSVAKGGKLHSPLALATSVCGVLTLICMSFVYAQTSILAWGTAYTHISFYGAAAALGSLAYGAVIIKAQPDSEGQVYSRIFSVAAIGGALQVLSLAPYLAALAAGSAAMQASAKLISQHGVLLVTSQALIIAGAIGFAFMAWKTYSTQGSRLAGQWLYSALVTVILGELAGRYLFYATGVHTMLGRL